MAVRRCAWCGKTLGLAPEVVGEFTDGMCEACEARFEAENALAHALVGLRAITEELERAVAMIWKRSPPGAGAPDGPPRRRRSDRP